MLNLHRRKISIAEFTMWHIDRKERCVTGLIRVTETIEYEIGQQATVYFSRMFNYTESDSIVVESYTGRRFLLNKFHEKKV